VSSVSIYMEGGGKGRGRQAILRNGMDRFLKELKDLTLGRRWRWNLVLCGGRGDTYNAFRRAVKGGKSGVVILLVDSEIPVTAPTYHAHLRSHDRWNLSFAADDQIHLMVQMLETWIVADRQALNRYYGAGFNSSLLPRPNNLEAASAVDKTLERATRRARKGEYRKIDHASDLLSQIDPEMVRKRCPACRRLFETLAEEIGR